MRIRNFGIIKNEATEDKMKQDQAIDHEEIRHYPSCLQEQICSSIFRNSHRQDMHIKKKTIKEHFVNKKVGVGRVKFLKKIKDDMYAQCW